MVRKEVLESSTEFCLLVMKHDVVVVCVRGTPKDHSGFGSQSVSVVLPKRGIDAAKIGGSEASQSWKEILAHTESSQSWKEILAHASAN